VSRPIKNPLPRIDLEAEALAALEEARAKAPGPERIEALKRAGILRNAVDMQGLPFAKRADRQNPNSEPLAPRTAIRPLTGLPKQASAAARELPRPRERQASQHHARVARVAARPIVIFQERETSRLRRACLISDSRCRFFLAMSGS
jgi:hypothetical protein